MTLTETFPTQCQTHQNLVNLKTCELVPSPNSTRNAFVPRWRHVPRIHGDVPSVHQKPILMQFMKTLLKGCMDQSAHQWHKLELQSSRLFQKCAWCFLWSFEQLNSTISLGCVTHRQLALLMLDKRGTSTSLSQRSSPNQLHHELKTFDQHLSLQTSYLPHPSTIWDGWPIAHLTRWLWCTQLRNARRPRGLFNVQLFLRCSGRRMMPQFCLPKLLGRKTRTFVGSKTRHETSDATSCFDTFISLHINSTNVNVKYIDLNRSQIDIYLNLKTK